MPKASRLPHNLPPLMLTEEAAAEYCGVSLVLFRATCPVKPRNMAKGLERSPCWRWNAARLREWLDRDEPAAGSGFDAMLEELGNDYPNSRRQQSLG